MDTPPEMYIAGWGLSPRNYILTLGYDARLEGNTGLGLWFH